MAKPTNSVRVMVCEASGCCAIEFKADVIERPCPNPGPITPKQVVIPAVMMETVAIIVVLSIVFIFKL